MTDLQIDRIVNAIAGVAIMLLIIGFNLVWLSCDLRDLRKAIEKLEGKL